jgi:hypothetical protein
VPPDPIATPLPPDESPPGSLAGILDPAPETLFLDEECVQEATLDDQPVVHLETVPIPLEVVASTSQDNTADCDEVTLDDDILQILGEDPSSAVQYAPEIRKEIASRMQYTAVEGLSKEARKELIQKYRLPSNCLQIGAPAINPEIKAALNENIIKRDQGIQTK